jgi:hypothetical protein
MCDNGVDVSFVQLLKDNRLLICRKTLAYAIGFPFSIAFHAAFVAEMKTHVFALLVAPTKST